MLKAYNTTMKIDTDGKSWIVEPEDFEPANSVEEFILKFTGKCKQAGVPNEEIIGLMLMSLEAEATITSEGH
jgi:hypothetical protein